MNNPEPFRRADFYERVYEIVRLIPRGRVTTYGAIARCLNRKGAARMVGYALTASNRQGITNVPAQRVVNRNGLLTGKAHFGAPNRMQQLLEAEGVRVEQDRVVDFDNLFWDPMQLFSDSAGRG